MFVCGFKEECLETHLVTRDPDHLRWKKKIETAEKGKKKTKAPLLQLKSETMNQIIS